MADSGQGGAAGGTAGGAVNFGGEIQPPPPPPPRSRLTHVSEAMITFFKGLPLAAKLARNKAIEEKNLAALVAYTEGPIPDTASYITIEDEEMESLRDPTTFEGLRSKMPSYLICKLGPLLNPKGEKRKATAEDLNPSSSRRKLIDPANEVDRAFINHNQTSFPDILIRTEEHVRIPLKWFTNDNITFINRNLSSFPTMKTPAVNDEKSIPILNMHAVANNAFFSCLHGELPADFAEWLEAAYNMTNFQALRDIEGSSTNQQWFNCHFGFFINQADKVRLYDAWKDKDLELRIERREKQARFDRSHYEQVYGIAKESFKADQKAREEMKSELDALKASVASLSTQRSAASSNRGKGGGSNGGSGRGSRSNNQSFQSGGSGFASNPTCILCGRKGHAVQDHEKTHPKSWPDGTSLWAQQKPDSKSVTTSDGKDICFNYNIHGKASRCSRDNSKCTRLHVSIPELLRYKDFSSSVHQRHPQPHIPDERKDIFHRIITPYNPDSFQLELDAHNLSGDYPLLVHNLRHGFPIGNMPKLEETIIIPNAASCRDHMDDIDTYLMDEVAADRMSGPFSRSEVEDILGGPFFSSPLVVVVQSQGPGLKDKVRICRHLSKGNKHADSVNSHIVKEDFPTRFDLASRVADIVASAPPGTQACALDIEKFHRTCPVLPSHKCWLVTQGRPGEFFIDHVHPFGCACASSNSGMIANAVVDIWHAKEVSPILKYEDDIGAFRSPVPGGPFSDGEFSYTYDRETLLSHVAPLCVPWHPEKGDGVFREVFTFIGFMWDLPKKTVSLPEVKRLKFLHRVSEFLQKYEARQCPLAEVEKIHGSLCHVAFVYRDGRSRLPSLSNFATTFKGNRLTKRYPSRSAISDLKWWRDKLSMPGFIRDLNLSLSPADIGLFVDACTSWGIGIYVGGKWMAFRLAPDWKTEGRHIGWLETLAIELAVYLVYSRGFRNTHLLLHSDNQGTIGSIAKGRCRNTHINDSVRRTYDVLVPASVDITLAYVESASNPADPISRGVLGLPSDRIPLSFALPHDLTSVLEYV
ncbi:hypothetical protein EST38_g9772 [Candolleomyces aberdarensis]|uniref:C3H1-type domain-containing protein n=1 Tax=Candolleomyces aberdarensis TaxID=2316362 RepID=A0A4Q2DAT1_9AGAR|nr:hypothetical protein EST38_g9772 [Candolleomyces aberdarensis]